MNPKGIGIIIKDRQPSKVPAHWTPKLLKICLANREKHPPTMDLRIVFAAKTDAALRLLGTNNSLFNKDLRTYN
jgi:hypothetical protein